MSNSNPTVTQREQWMVESKVSEIYQLFSSLPHPAQAVMLELQRDQHMEYLNKGLNQLGPSFCVLDANRPWLCYWILHSIALLGECIDCERQDDAVDFLNRCQDHGGGYGGGPGQMPHLATTYAAVNSLITLGGEKALSSVNREKLYGFLFRMKDSSGGFRMHNAGEMDVRACYTAISVASVLNILDNELVKNVGDYILSCQTYEGGIAGEPGSEAHGGYTFCGLATMILINEADRLDLPGLVDWVVFRQGVEGGFQGRSNKLVDGCYSFWQGCVFALIQRLPSIAGEQLHLSVGKGKQERGSALSVGISNMSEKESDLGTLSSFDERKLSDIGISFIEGHTELGPLFHSVALQQYILLCSQDTHMPGFWLISQMLAPKSDSFILSGVQEGGFKDKPGKYKDYYHTCYCLSGLSVCQHCWSRDADSSPFPKAVFGPYSNLLEPIHPIYNLVLDSYYEAHNYFSGSEAS